MMTAMLFHRILQKPDFPLRSSLMAGNTTFLVCSEDSQVDEIIDIIKHCSRRRKQYVPASTMGGVDMQSTSFPLEVPVGGATIFVTDIERFEKV